MRNRSENRLLCSVEISFELLSASTKVWTLGNTTKTRESDQGMSRETIAGILAKLKADLLKISLRPIYYTTGTWERAE